VIAAQGPTISIKSLKLPDAGATIEIPPRRIADVIAAITGARIVLVPPFVPHGRIPAANPCGIGPALRSSLFPRH
jgi:hypothetical protein